MPARPRGVQRRKDTSAPLDSVELFTAEHAQHPFGDMEWTHEKIWRELVEPHQEQLWAEMRKRWPKTAGRRPWWWWNYIHGKERAIVHPLASTPEWAPHIERWREEAGGVLHGQSYFGAKPHWGPLLEDETQYLVRIGEVGPEELAVAREQRVKDDAEHQRMFGGLYGS